MRKNTMKKKVAAMLCMTMLLGQTALGEELVTRIEPVRRERTATESIRRERTTQDERSERGRRRPGQDWGSPTEADKPDASVELITPPTSGGVELITPPSSGGAELITPPTSGGAELITPPTSGGAELITPPTSGGAELITPPTSGGVELITPPTSGGAELITPPTSGGAELITPPTSGGVELITPPTSGGAELITPPTSGGVELITPPTSGGAELITPPTSGGVELITPPTSGSSEQKVKAFSIRPTARRGQISVEISGASSREIEVELLTLDGKQIASSSIIGNGTVKLGEFAEGKYTVRAQYVTPVQNKDGSFDYMTVAESIVVEKNRHQRPDHEKATDIQAHIETGRNYIIITVTEANARDMIVSIEGLQDKKITRGASVRYDGLVPGRSYHIEIDYIDYIEGAKKFAQTVKLEGPDMPDQLQYGDEGEAVRRLTRRLAALGYPVEETSRYGSTVREAVKLFQRANGLHDDGVAGARTLRVLYSDHAAAYNAGDYPTLERGDRYDALIYTLQQRLKDLGYYTIKVDGIFGSGTQRAVREFQRVNGLSVTGKADNATQKLLYSSAAKPAGSSGVPSDYETLSRSGKYKSAVVPLQKRLRELGYYSGNIDGYFGSQTYRAVRNFQSRNGLTVTGVADAYTQQILYSASAKTYSGSTASSGSESSGYRLLYWGCRGDAVKRLQNALISAGYKSIVREADGIFGQWTYDAVRAYQKDHGLAVDGIAGKNTQNALYGTKY